MPFFIFLANDDVGFSHFIIEIVALAGTLADTGKHRDAAMQLGDVVDQLHDDNRLANTGAAESTDLAALEERTDQVNDLDACRKDLR